MEGCSDQPSVPAMENGMNCFVMYPLLVFLLEAVAIPPHKNRNHMLMAYSTKSSEHVQSQCARVCLSVLLFKHELGAILLSVAQQETFFPSTFVSLFANPRSSALCRSDLIDSQLNMCRLRALARR